MIDLDYNCMMATGPPDMERADVLAYYDKLEEYVEMNKLQGNQKEYKKTGENAMIYEKSAVPRRNKYGTRSKTMIMKVSIPSNNNNNNKYTPL